MSGRATKVKYTKVCVGAVSHAALLAVDHQFQFPS